MFRLAGRCLLKPKSLHDMFRRLKLQGAHPDVLWSIDAQKAQHNGDEMIRLETLMHQRSTTAGGGGGVKSQGPQSISFWLRPATTRATTTEAHQLQFVSCTLTPQASSHVVKQQLTQLFRDAGILDEFELDGDKAEVNLERVLRDADVRQSEHMHQASSLYLRGDRAITNMRKFGILVVVEEEGLTYLVTLPENANGTASSSAGIAGPSGALDYEAQEFLRERNLKPFDLRMAGSFSAVERFVNCFERLERLYDQHRGLALRPSVCFVLTLRGPSNYVADDGSIVLSLSQTTTWEEYLLALPQNVWRECVAAHQQWRLPPAPQLAERRRKLLRVADMFHIFNVVMEHRIGGGTQWQENLITRLLKEEVSIRNAVKKYNLKSDLLKRRGYLHFRETLPSALDVNKQIGFRVTGDGKLIINQSCMTSAQVLKVIRENLSNLERLTKEYDALVSQLEFMSRSLPLDFSVCSDWKLAEETNLVNCLQKFVATMKANQKQLDTFLKQLLTKPAAAAGQQQSSSSPSVLRPVPVRRLVWIVSNKFETMPSGVVYVPWDVDFESIKRLMLASA
ncbi:membrane-associated protein, putative [Bodo saltans]|uniref:Membrane-associated protein, putative n=1 Tax=Bodo saltans TaxID=75058 RepID=A0A0S4JET7_BODSA|nr:membrane-associated protein, putative [Bodo saltans]|eukprot:CUG88556.1 membrane-associated protein, putative [Bodo saltans]